MKVRYIGETDAREVVVNGEVVAVVERNHQAEVPDDIGKRLIEQSVWEKVTTKGGK